MTDRPRDRHLAAVPPPDDEGHTPLPHDDQLERTVLGGCLTWRTDIDDVTQTLTPQDLYQPRHELILHAITHLYARGLPVDTHAVKTRLGKDLNRIGGETYLHELANQAITPGNAGYHAQHLARLAAQRRLIQAGTAIQALGYQHTDTDLHELLDAATQELATIPRHIPGLEHDKPADSWAPVNLATILEGGLDTPEATILTRRDGKRLLYPAAIHSVSGEPGSGKTWVALVAAAQEIGDGRNVLMLDFEDRPQTIIARLQTLGVPTGKILNHLRYIRPDTALQPTSHAALDQAAQNCTLAIIDGITEAMTMHGLSLMDNEDVARWLHLIPRRIADLGPAVLQIDHVVKNADSRGRYAIGGQHKLAGITGAAYKMIIIKSFGAGAKGHAKLVVDKDKHGDIGPNGITAADLHMDATGPDGTIYAWLDTPHQALIAEDGHFRPTTLMERVSRFIETHPGTTGNGIKDNVRGKATSIAGAISALTLEAHLRVEDGPRGASYYYSVTPFRADADEAPDDDQ